MSAFGRCRHSSLKKVGPVLAGRCHAAVQFLRPHAKDLFFPPVPRVKQLVLGNSNALAETANVQSGGKLAVKTKFNGSFNHLMLVRILSQQLDNKVHMFVELTKLTFVLLLELLHPGLNMLCGDTFGTIVLQSVNGSTR